MICCRGSLQEWRLVVLMPPARRGVAISACARGQTGPGEPGEMERVSAVGVDAGVYCDPGPTI